MYLLYIFRDFWRWLLLAFVIVVIGRSIGYGDQATWLIIVMLFIVVGSRFVEDPLVAKARRAWGAGRFEDAAALLEEAIRENPAPNLYVSAAKVYLWMGQAERAVETCNKALFLDKKNPYAYHCRATAELTLNELDRSIEDATTALKFKRDFYEARVSRANALLLKQQHAQALDEVNAVLKQHSNLYSALSIKVNALAKLNRLDHAMLEANRLVELYAGKKMLQSYAIRASVYLRKGEIEKAMQDCTSELQANAKCISALLVRAYCHLDKEEYEEAMSDLELVPIYKPNLRQNASMLGIRARVKSRLADHSGALEDADAAVRLSPSSPALTSRGYVLLLAGQHAEALADLSKAIELDPYCAEAFWFRHEVYELLGKTPESQSDKKTALDFGYNNRK